MFGFLSWSWLAWLPFLATNHWESFGGIDPNNSDLINQYRVGGAIQTIDEAIGLIGIAVAVAVGGFFAFMIVSMALGWGRSALGAGAEQSDDEEENDEL